MDLLIKADKKTRHRPHRFLGDFLVGSPGTFLRFLRKSKHKGLLVKLPPGDDTPCNPIHEKARLVPKTKQRYWWQKILQGDNGRGSTRTLRTCNYKKSAVYGTRFNSRGWQEWPMRKEAKDAENTRLFHLSIFRAL